MSVIDQSKKKKMDSHDDLELMISVEEVEELEKMYSNQKKLQKNQETQYGMITIGDPQEDHFQFSMNKSTMEKYGISRGDVIHLKNEIFQTVLIAVPNFHLELDQFLINPTVAYNLNLKTEEKFEFKIMKEIKSITKLYLKVNKKEDEKEIAMKLLEKYFEKQNIPLFTGNVFHLNHETEEIPWIQTSEIISTFVYECDKIECKNEEDEKGIVLKNTIIELKFNK
jgi:hypothetical protein